MTWIADLRDLRACPEAVEWAETQPSLADAWRECQRGDWMLWLLGRLLDREGSDAHRQLVGAMSACARLALPFWEDCRPDDRRVRDALDAQDRYAAGECGLEEMRAAVWAAGAAAGAAAEAAAGAAAEAAAEAAGAAAEAAGAAAEAAAGDAGDAGDAARARVLAQCAGIVRAAYPKPPDHEE